MASLVTPEFEKYIAQQTVNNSTVEFDEFIFANIPNLTADNLSQHLVMPDAGLIVHRQPVSKAGVINENAVVYSVTMGTEIGDFDFNFVGLINKSANKLMVAVQANLIKKIRNQHNVQGNSLTRSILLEFVGAKALTGISVSAESWQIDFTVRLAGLDEKIRLTNRDLYGRAVFFDNGFLLEKITGNNYKINAGEAYIEGVRAKLTDNYDLTLNSLPCSVYVDAVHHNTVTGEYQTELKFITENKSDYKDSAHYQHYVQIIADIDSNGIVTDRRLLSPFSSINPKDLEEASESTKDGKGHSHKLPFAGLLKRGIVKLYSGFDSDSEELGATAKAVKRLKALIDGVTSNLGNYIPNSKKSNAVDSPSADNVATSAAVKAANDNANGRVSKFGDVIEWLKVQRRHAWLTIASSEHVSAAIDFIVRAGKNPQASIETLQVGRNAVEMRFHLTPEGDNYEHDRRHHAMTIGYGGHIWTKPYGWLQDFFATKAENNTKVAKTGDVIEWLSIEGNRTWLTIKSKAGEAAGVDFIVWGGRAPQASITATDIGGYAVEQRFFTTPTGDNYDSDRRRHTMTLEPGGHIWTLAYGWLQDYFAKQSDNNNIWNELGLRMHRHDFVRSWFPNHYAGAEVYKIRHLNMMITVMNTTNAENEFYLPEAYDGHAIALAGDRGGGNIFVRAIFRGGNRIYLSGRGDTHCHVLVIGFKQM